MSKIGGVLQKDILSLMISDKQYFYKLRRLLSPNLFSIKAYKFFYKYLIQYHEKNEGEMPSKKAALLFLSKRIKDDETKASFRKKIIAIYRTEIESPKGLFQEILEWAESQKFGKILEKAADASISGDLKRAKNIIKSSFIFDSDEDEIFEIHSVFETWKKRQKQRKIESTSKKFKQIKTGLGPLDRKLYIRKYEPTLCLIMGTSGIGKSIFAINFGVYALNANCNVAHFVFENTAKQTLARYDSRLTEYPYSYLKRFKWTKADLSRANKVMRTLKSKRSNCLKVIHAPVDTVSVLDIESILKEIELKEEWVPDVIIYDMLDDLLPSERQESFRLSVKKTVKEIKKQTEERNIPIICTTHAKASAKGGRIRQEDFSESYDRPRTADIVLTISQTPEQEDDRQAEIRLDKYRDDEGKISILVDLLFHIMTIRFVEEIHSNEEESND